MYFNDIHIIAYLIIGLLGCLTGQISAMLAPRLGKHKEIFSKQAFKELKINFEAHYISMIINAILYIALLYAVGIDFKNWYANIDLISYIVLIPLLICAFWTDMKYEIIPNRLIITLFEIGMISVFANGVFNPNGISLAFYRVSALTVGGVIFLIITLIGRLIAGKEAMGMGDVKFIGVLRIILRS